jgi:1-acyl-sn-glycerol-3-phosphate acyltransferase
MIVWQTIFSLALWFTLIVSWLITFPVYCLLWIVTVPFDSKRRAVKYFTGKWGSCSLSLLSSTKVTISGQEKIPTNRGVVVVSNHQSMTDIFVLLRLCWAFIFVSKKENYYVPVLGQVMYLNGYVYLDRQNPMSFPKMFTDCSRALQKGLPVILFPEGTRSLDGNLGRFKDGAFKMAIENKTSIIPVVLDGAANLLPKEGFIIQSGDPIFVSVLDEIPYEKFPSYNPTVLKEYVKSLIAAELENIRQERKKNV